MGTMRKEALLEDLAPFTKLIAHELLAHLKEGGLILAPASIASQRADSRSPDGRELLTLKEAAALLDHNYFWLSRNYRRLNLRPVRISGKRLFMRKEVESLLERHRARFRGRPPKPSSSAVI